MWSYIITWCDVMVLWLYTAIAEKEYNMARAAAAVPSGVWLHVWLVDDEPTIACIQFKKKKKKKLLKEEERKRKRKNWKKKVQLESRKKEKRKKEKERKGVVFEVFFFFSWSIKIWINIPLIISFART